ncbi:MAG: M42 family metallopeptidase [Firmicutes bacterium]|nr:M42 family metallopeptidase [Bacillota bacterium]
MLLKRLTEACGGPGQEHEVRDLIRSEVTGLVDEIRTDALGNLITVKNGSKSGPRVMLAAHMDEVALMILSIEKSGLLKFSPIGGIDPRVLVAKSVVIGKNRVPGVIGSKPIHLQRPEERQKALTIDELYIDIGASKKEEAEKLVSIGDLAYFTTKFAEIGPDKYKAKALDDRVGCAMLIDILRDNYQFPLYGVFTVQEEVGLRGAGTAAYQVQPDIAIVLEGTTASDVPEIPEHKHATSVGKGPCLTLMDSSVIPDQRLTAKLLKLAAEYNIPVQYRRNTAGGTDAGKIQQSRTGVRVAVVALPCRYIHSPVSVCSKSDYENAVKLVKAFLRSIEEGGEI